MVEKTYSFMYEGKEVEVYTLRNAQGMEMD